MTIIVLDIECIDENIIKELGIFKDEQVLGFSFLPPKDFTPTTQTHWLTAHLHGIDWNSGKLHYSMLRPILRNLLSPTSYFYAKGQEKCFLLSQYLGEPVHNIEELGCPLMKNLVVEEDDGVLFPDCSNYDNHCRSLHCAERKAYTFGMWTLKYFETN